MAEDCEETMTRLQLNLWSALLLLSFVEMILRTFHII